MFTFRHAALSSSIFAALSICLISCPVRAQDQPDPSLHVSVKRELIVADDLMVEGKYGDAADIYRQVLNIDSHDANALAGLGMALGRQFKLDAADEQFDKLLQIDPNNAVAHCGKAMVLLNRLQSSSNTNIKNRNTLLRDAGRECNKALDADPRVVEAHYLLGRVFKEEGRLDKAAQAFGGAIKLDPKYSNAYAQLGLVQVLDNKLSDATANFKKAISINTGNSTAHFGMAQVLLKQNRIDGAVAELNISLYQNPNSAPVHQLMGKAYEIQGNTAAAVKEYKEAIRIKPESPAAYLSIAGIEEGRGDIEMAIADLRSGLQLVPDDAELLSRIANDSLRIDKLDDAIKNFEAAANASPNFAPAVEGLTRALYLQAQKESAGAFFASNDYEQARASIERAINLTPNNIQLRLAQIKLKALSGQSVDFSQVAPPRNDAGRPAYAEVLLAQGKYAEAAEQMMHAINGTDNPAELFALGDLALTIKDLPSAEFAYKRAAAFPGHSERANRGLDLVARGREQARQNLTFANDLARKRQFAAAADKYRLAVYQDPRVAEAHLYLAQNLERLPDPPAKTIREVIAQYKAYLQLTPGINTRAQDKLKNHLAKLESQASKDEQPHRSPSQPDQGFCSA